jgi:glycerophosphoryl diester phosphodiesterase
VRKRRIGAALAALLIGGIYLANASWLAPEPQGVPVVLAHRGVHQTFRREGLDPYKTCTATRIYPPTNPYRENTIPSMRASFAAGATAIEVDVHPTTDGEFAVFHDWTLECRTNGQGVTREQPMSYLRTLDVGYGYTADGGRTFPFRGKGVGMMKTLDEVLKAFPGRQILINVKSKDPHESERLVAYLKAHGDPIDRRLWVWAEAPAGDRLRELAPEAVVINQSRVKSCSYRYLALGWSGYVPEVCRGGAIGVPVNLRWAVWGWPNRFLKRMKDARVLVMLAGPLRGKEPLISERGQLDAVPKGFDGVIVTDYIERIGPVARRRWPTKS